MPSRSCRHEAHALQMTFCRIPKLRFYTYWKPNRVDRVRYQLQLESTTCVSGKFFVSGVDKLKLSIWTIDGSFGNIC